MTTILTAGWSVAILLVLSHTAEASTEQARLGLLIARQEMKVAATPARPEWLENWRKFKQENDRDVVSNQRRIDDLRKEVGALDSVHRGTYNDRIGECERRNNDLRDRVNNCRDEGDAKWGEFKKKVKQDMDDLNSSLKNFTVRNN
jgi:predicted  nucleic acid-binding Zn-ribbon protein